MPDFFLDVEDEAISDITRKQEKMSGQGSSDNDLLQFFQRLKNGCNEELVSNAKAIYQFNLSEDGLWYLDLKNGSGTVYTCSKTGHYIILKYDRNYPP